jgi:hypothetical protein
LLLLLLSSLLLLLLLVLPLCALESILAFARWKVYKYTPRGTLPSIYVYPFVVLEHVQVYTLLSFFLHPIVTSTFLAVRRNSCCLLFSSAPFLERRIGPDFVDRLCASCWLVVVRMVVRCGCALWWCAVVVRSFVAQPPCSTSFAYALCAA